MARTLLLHSYYFIIYSILINLLLLLFNKIKEINITGFSHSLLHILKLYKSFHY